MNVFSLQPRLRQLFESMAPGDRVVIYEAMRIADENRDYSPVEHFAPGAHDHLTIICETLSDLVEDDRDETREKVWL